MVNSKRAPYPEAMKDRCRALRLAGHDTAAITEKTGVPGSTISRWAAEGGWRLRDVHHFTVPEIEELRPAHAGLRMESLPEDVPPVLALESATLGAITDVREAIAEGRWCDVPKASTSIERLVRALKVLKQIGEHDASVIRARQREAEEARAELTRRLDRLAEAAMRGD